MKVVITLETLGLPYESEWIDMSKIKQEPYISVTPNGRLPAITDPNTGITLWESGAIIQYLVDRYDTKRTFSFAPGSDAYHLANQWSFFQASGQGPYYGQVAWFKLFHAEKLPSAIERYQKEAERVIGVVDLHLKRSGLKYLVADEENLDGKYSFADASFVPWSSNLAFLLDKDVFEGGEYDAYKGWFERVQGQEGVKKALALQQKQKEEQEKQKQG